VVGLVAGAWAQVRRDSDRPIDGDPDVVLDAQAATLPTAGLTALRGLEVAGLVLGKRVLVTGATGGVGRIAIQLARESGAHVTALVRDAAAAQELLRLSAPSMSSRTSPATST
jgi:NADPH2:quinone reductase